PALRAPDGPARPVPPDPGERPDEDESGKVLVPVAPQIVRDDETAVGPADDNHGSSRTLQHRREVLGPHVRIVVAGVRCVRTSVSAQIHRHEPASRGQLVVRELVTPHVSGLRPTVHEHDRGRAGFAGHPEPDPEPVATADTRTEHGVILAELLRSAAPPSYGPHQSSTATPTKETAPA